MPNRVIREEVSTSQSLAKVTLFAEGFWFKLLTAIDDHGRFDARTHVLRGRLYPLRPRVTVRMIEGWIEELAAVGTVRLYEVGGIRYGMVPAWAKHNRLRAKDSKYPTPPSRDGSRQHMLSGASNSQQPPADVGLTRAGADLDKDLDVEPPSPASRDLPPTRAGDAEKTRPHASRTAAMTPEELVRVWNANRGGMAQAEWPVTAQRQRRIRAFLASRPALRPDEFGSVVGALGRDDWACGKSPRRAAPLGLDNLLAGDAFERQREKLLGKRGGAGGEVAIGRGPSPPPTNADVKLRELYAAGLSRDAVALRFREWKAEVGDEVALSPAQDRKAEAGA